MTKTKSEKFIKSASISFLALVGLVFVLNVKAISSWSEVDLNSDGKVNSMDIVEMFSLFGCPNNCPGPTPTPSSSQWTSCAQSPLGVSIQGLPSSACQGDDNCHSGPTVVRLSDKGYGGLAGSLNCNDNVQYFPQLSANWEKQSICNSHECLCGRSSSDTSDNYCQQNTWSVGSALCTQAQYDYLGYGPERLGGVPLPEQNNLPWAVPQAKNIADASGKKLHISFGTVQLHLEAYERPECGNDWNNIQCIVDMLAPHGDAWSIQAADEFNNPAQTGNSGPVLSQMHYLPGPAWRAEAQRWYNAIKSANPNIEVWIQLALHKYGDADNYPASADLVLEYREWLVGPQYGPPVVDGVYISSVYSYPNNEGWMHAEAELERAFDLACGQISTTPTPPTGGTPTPTPTSGGTPTVTPSPPPGNITLIEEGWTDNKQLTGLTLAPGFYYRVYENTSYPCGNQGNHQFIVFDNGTNQTTNKHLFVKFLGGGTGFWYDDPNDAIPNGNLKEYYSHSNALGLLNADLNYNWMFRAGVSAEYANGITKRMRDEHIKNNADFRMVIPSYCSHDLYYGTGEYSSVDGFSRWGYSAAKAAVDFVQNNFITNKVITFGGSAGSSGSFSVGKDIANVAGIIMDSMSTDLSAASQSCLNGINVFANQQGNSNHPCCCPEPEPDGSPPFSVDNGWCPAGYRTPCLTSLAGRIGFNLGTDEPHQLIQRGEVNIPIFYIWNYHDAGIYAPYLYNNLQSTIRQYNPAGKSVACRVCAPNNDPNIDNSCINDDNYQPIGSCNTHVPSGVDDYPELVNDVYNWIQQRIAGN